MSAIKVTAMTAPRGDATDAPHSATEVTAMSAREMPQ